MTGQALAESAEPPGGGQFPRNIHKQTSADKDDKQQASESGGIVKAYNVHNKERRMMTVQEFSSLQFDGWISQPQSSTSKSVNPLNNVIEVVNFYTGTHSTMTEYEFLQQESQGGNFLRVVKEQLMERFAGH